MPNTSASASDAASEAAPGHTHASAPLGWSGLHFTRTEHPLDDVQCKMRGMDRLRLLFDLLGQNHLNTPLAARLGVSRMRLSRWRHGPTAPDRDQCKIISEFVAEQMFTDQFARSAVATILTGWARGLIMADGDDQRVRALLEQHFSPETNEIAVLRAKCGLSSKDAAALLGVRRQTLHTWERTPAKPERLAACRAAWVRK